MRLLQTSTGHRYRSNTFFRSVTRHGVIHVFENALYVTERHERADAFCEP